MKIAILDLWRDEDRAKFFTVRDAMSERGIEVVDLFEPTSMHSTATQWIDAMMAKLEGSFAPNEDIHLVGFCAGGRVAMTMCERLEKRGRRPAFVGLIETWQRSPLVELNRALYSRYDIAPKLMVRQQLQWLTSTPGANWRDLLGAYRANATSFLRRRRVRHGAQQRSSSSNEWLLMHFTHASPISVITSPVHLFNCAHSVSEFFGDPSLGIAPYLRGGFTVHLLDGDHHSCTQEPLQKALIDDITTTIETPNSSR